MAAVRSPVQLLRQRPAAADALLALALAALAELEIWTSANPGAPRFVVAATALVSLLALGWRRRAPLPSALVALGALTLASAFWHLEGAWIAFAILLLATTSSGSKAGWYPSIRSLRYIHSFL